MAQFRWIEPHVSRCVPSGLWRSDTSAGANCETGAASGGRREAVLSAGRIAAGGNATGASTVGVGSSAGDAGACVGGEIASPSTVPLPACAGVTGLSELVGGASACVGAATLSWACPAGAFVASRATSTGGSCASVGSSMGGVRASPGGAAAVRGVTTPVRGAAATRSAACACRSRRVRTGRPVGSVDERGLRPLGNWRGNCRGFTQWFRRRLPWRCGGRRRSVFCLCEHRQRIPGNLVVG